MNKDRISRTPGGTNILIGVIALVLAYFAWQGLRYELGQFGTLVLGITTAFGLGHLAFGLYRWKYTDRRAFAREMASENLLIDIPLQDRTIDILHRIEDALIELIRNTKAVAIEMHSVDVANNMGTIHLKGQQADAMFAFVYQTLGRFAVPGGLHLFPKPGMPIDTEIHGKRLLVDLPGTGVQL